MPGWDLMSSSFPKFERDRVPDVVMDRAACRGKPEDMFFPDYGDDLMPADPDALEQQIEHATRVCKTCPVQPECLQYALSLGKDIHGIWGGYDEVTLRGMSRRMRIKRGMKS